MRYWVQSDDDEENEEPKYACVLHEEEYIDSDDELKGYEGVQAGRVILENENKIKPWDPHENFFAYI